MTTRTPQDYVLEPVAQADKKTGNAADAAFWAWWDPYELSEYWFTEIHKIARDAWNAAPQSGWISVDERLPPCDGETMFIGKNESGYIACFNRFTDDGYCFHDSAESEICVMSGLRVWRRVDLPPPPSTKGDPT